MSAITLVVTMHDGTKFTVTPTLEDTLAFENTLRKNKRWGGLEDNALKMMPFRAWNLLRRTGQTALSWDEFTTGDTAALDVSKAPSSDDETDTGDDAEDGVEEVAGVGKAGRKARSTGSSSRSQ